MPATLNTAEIITDVLEAFKVRFPMLSNFATDFSNDEVKFNQQVIARVSSVPTVRDYDATTGYRANAAEANDIVEDVAVTINRHKHVPVKIDYIDQISTKRDLYNETIGNLAFALGKEAFDYAMSLVVAANFSTASTFSHANSDKDMLDDVTSKLNTRGANPVGRYGIVNSAVFTALDNDARIASSEFYGERRGGEGYGVIRNTAGFQTIYEYPGMPTNSANVSGFFGTRESFVMASRLPRNVFDIAARIGIPQIASADVVTDAETGLSLMGITWQEQGTFDIITTMVWLYGIAAGKQGGSNDTKTDRAGIRLITA